MYTLKFYGKLSDEDDQEEVLLLELPVVLAGMQGLAPIGVSSGVIANRIASFSAIQEAISAIITRVEYVYDMFTGLSPSQIQDIQRNFGGGLSLENVYTRAFLRELDIGIDGAYSKNVTLGLEIRESTEQAALLANLPYPANDFFMSGAIRKSVANKLLEQYDALNRATERHTIDNTIGLVKTSLKSPYIKR